MTYPTTLPSAGDREKRLVAFSSVVAAIFLTGMKLVIGLATGSLGILSEAAHSGLDLVAAVATMVAVRISGRPADSGHTYGHGKIENLSALFETVLLLLTCVWIIYEAIQRLFFREVQVESSVWSFLVMGFSIVIDITRSRALARAARKYSSQALEADALHFSTDIWSSSVVIGGLVLVALAHALNLEWLNKADSVAAVGVAFIVVIISIQLGRRTITALLDGVAPGLLEDVAEAAHVPGVLEVLRARVRVSGPETFADVVLAVAPHTPLDSIYHVTTEAREAVRHILPGADVVVQVDPGQLKPGGLLETARWIAARNGMGVHSVHLYEVPDKRVMDLHLEVDETLTIGDAHALAGKFETELQSAIPGLGEIVTHLEPAGDSSATQTASPEDQARLSETIRAVAQSLDTECSPHNFHVYRVEGDLAVSFHILLPAVTTLREAHGLTERFERSLRSREPALSHVVIHAEPADVE